MSQGKISITTAVIMNINMMVGAGIFIFPMFMTREAGYFSFFGWPLVALIFLPIVLSISEVSTLFPGEGSFYSYSKAILGRSVGFISGWLYVLGYIAVAAIHLVTLKTILSKEAGITIIGQFPLVFYTIVILFFCILTSLRLDLVGKLLSAGTIFKLLPIAFVCILLIFYIIPTERVPLTFSFPSLLSTIPFALFGYWGFETCVTISHRIKGSSKNAARAIFIGFITTVIIYTLFNISLLHIMGPTHLAQKGVREFVYFLPFASKTLQTLFILTMKSAIAMAHTTVFFATLITGSFLLNSMARENLIFLSQFFKKTNRFEQPQRTIFLQGIVILSMVATITNIPGLTAISNLGILTAFILTLISLFFIHQQKNNIRKMVLTLCGFVSWSLLTYYSLQEIGSIQNIIPFLAIALGGFLLFKIREMMVKAS